MRSYKQLTREQRYQIYALIKAENTQVEMAKIIGVHKSTISRELSRNTGKKGYRPKQADETAQRRQDEKVRFRIDQDTWQWVEYLIEEDWSPEQVSLWLWDEEQIEVSHESIYQYIYWDKANEGTLHTHLRCRKKNRKRYGHYDRRGSLKNQRSIETRPAVVEERTRLGDWECDTIIGKNHKQALVSVTERTGRLTLIAKVEHKDAKSVSSAIVELIKTAGVKIITMTADNGREFAEHEFIAQTLNADFYFAHPYCSWERGSNENMNGLVRQYFPKGSDFSSITQKDLNRVMRKLNNRPRKCLGMKTPNQVMYDIDPMVALAN